MTAYSPLALGCAVAHDLLRERPFHAASYELALAGSGGWCTLTRLDPGEPERLGAAFAAMNPWAAYRLPAESLARFMAAEEHDCVRLAIRLDGQICGAVVVRFPWLHGPYLQFLGLLECRQGLGLGKAVLEWMAAEAPAGTRNLWLCVSAMNERARAFYQRNGYEVVATIPELAADDIDEILMRRRLQPRVRSAED